MLSRLLPLLDGQHSTEALCAELTLGSGHLDQALNLLGECSLLEWVTPGDTDEVAAGPVATYLSRTIKLTDGHRCAGDLAGDLLSATVLLAAPSGLAGPIAADLLETGIGAVEIVSAAEIPSACGQADGRCVAAVFDGPADEGALETVVSGAVDLPVLRFGGYAGRAEVGPVFYGTSTACLDCFRRGYREVSAGAPPPADADATAADEMLAALTVSELLAMLARPGPGASPRSMTRTTMCGRPAEHYDVLPEPECGSCGGGTPPTDPDSRGLLGYEWQISQLPPALSPQGALSPSGERHLVELQRQRDGLLPAPRHPLPADTGDRPPGAPHGQARLDEQLLAGILARVAGFRPRRDAVPAGMAAARWAPSGGNLASPGIYLVTEADLFGLPGTIFLYDDIDHEMVSAGADRVPLAQILDGTNLDAGSADLAVVLVGAVGRLSQKYGDFAWHLAHLDAGCAALQLHTAAACHGLSVTFAANWPARLAETLELDERREVVTAVAAIHAAGEPRTEGSPPCRW